MVGGKEEAYEKAAKILQHMGKNVIHTGVTGTGQVIFKHSIGTVLQINLLLWEARSRVPWQIPGLSRFPIGILTMTKFVVAKSNIQK